MKVPIGSTYLRLFMEAEESMPEDWLARILVTMRKGQYKFHSPPKSGPRHWKGKPRYRTTKMRAPDPNEK